VAPLIEAALAALDRLPMTYPCRHPDAAALVSSGLGAWRTILLL